MARYKKASETCLCGNDALPNRNYCAKCHYKRDKEYKKKYKARVKVHKTRDETRELDKIKARGKKFLKKHGDDFPLNHIITKAIFFNQ